MLQSVYNTERQPFGDIIVRFREIVNLIEDLALKVQTVDEIVRWK